MQNNQHNDLSQFINILSTGNKDLKKKTADEMVSKLNPNEKEELNSIMNDKEKLNSILSSPVVRQILKKMNTDKNG